MAEKADWGPGGVAGQAPACRPGPGVSAGHWSDRPDSHAGRTCRVASADHGGR
jgi:hypothetical protein